jgi:hypothetical protein
VIFIPDDREVRDALPGLARRKGTQKERNRRVCS